MDELPCARPWPRRRPRQDIVDKLPAARPERQGAEQPHVLPGQSNYKDNAGAYDTVDTAKADSCLTDAGYTMGADGIYEKGGQKRRSSWCGARPTPAAPETQLIQAAVKAFGIDIQLAPAPDFTFLDAGAFDIPLFGWTGVASQAANKSIYVATVARTTRTRSEDPASSSTRSSVSPTRPSGPIC